MFDLASTDFCLDERVLLNSCRQANRPGGMPGAAVIYLYAHFSTEEVIAYNHHGVWE